MIKINQASIFINTTNCLYSYATGLPYIQLRGCCVPLFVLELYVLEMIPSRSTYTKRKCLVEGAVVPATVNSLSAPVTNHSQQPR
jgi:hypothetical protein